MTFIHPNYLRLMSPQDRPKGTAGMLQSEIKDMNDKRSEKELQKDIIGYIRLRGVRFIDSPRMDKRATNRPGAPDIRFSYKGIPFYFEVKKAKDGVLSDDQIQCISDMKFDGWRGGVIHGVEGAKMYLDAADEILHKKAK